MYKTFITFHYFGYCPSSWHFCSASDREKLELLNKRALRAVSEDETSTYEEFLERGDQRSLNDFRIQNHLRLILKLIMF